MKDNRYSIDTLKKDINTLTKKEKLAFIKDKINTYQEWKYNKDRDYSGQLFHHDFHEGAELLLKEIEGEDPNHYNHDFNWYFNADNIPNQNAVFATKDFLDIYRKDTFEPLFFFNLLFKQIDELKDNLDTPFDYIKSLNTLPYNDEQKHLLFGMILYWHGGNPVQNFNPKYSTILKLVEKEFLQQYSNTYTHEKRFCNYEGNQTEKLETEKINDIKNLSIQYNFPESKYFKRVVVDFESLPQYVVQKGIIWRFESIRFQDKDYDLWKSEWLDFLRTIPQQYILKTIVKGIEYAQKAYEFHKQHECSDMQKCAFNESWERRIAIAENTLSNINDALEKKKEPNKTDMSDIEFIQGKRSEKFWTNIDAISNKAEFYFEVTKDEETRRYSPNEFLNLVLECYYLAADKAENLNDKISCCVNAESTIKRYIRDNNLKEKGFDFSKIFEDLTDTAKRLEAYQKLGYISSTENEEETKRNNEFTTARQVLAMHFIFDQLQVRSNEIDRKVKAEFAQFLTSKNHKNVYDAFQNPFVTKQKKFRFEDLQYIRTYFENLGLSEIVKAINNQLDKPK